MTSTRQKIGVGLLALVFVLTSSSACLAHADIANAPQLRLSEINITGDEFIVIENVGTAAASLQQYWLGYNSNDSTTALPSQQLSNQTLEAGSAIVLNNGASATCGADELDALSFSLSNTAGKVNLWQMSDNGSSIDFGFVDGVSWGKSVTSTNYLHITDEANVAKYNPTTANATWYRASDENGQPHVWQVGDLQECTFTPVTSASSSSAAEAVTWEGADVPPFTVAATVNVAPDAGTSAHIPAADIGLKAVQVSEVLPNPASPQTDADDEFIELYNPNSAVFDLSGFKLQIGSITSSTTHTYTFPNGTLIAPQGFKAYMSSDTHLSLNNSGGQVWLLDPLDAAVSQSDTYGTAKDGYAWMKTTSGWQWTTQPTPGKTNVLAKPAQSGTNSTKTATAKGRTVSAIKGASTSAASGSNSNAAFATANQVTPIHTWTLALVACAALLYGAYEYRHDLANRIYQFRSNRAARRSARG